MPGVEHLARKATVFPHDPHGGKDGSMAVRYETSLRALCQPWIPLDSTFNLDHLAEGGSLTGLDRA
jgi:hypothetical protein